MSTEQIDTPDLVWVGGAPRAAGLPALDQVPDTVPPVQKRQQARLKAQAEAPKSWGDAIRGYRAEKTTAQYVQPVVERFSIARGRDWENQPQMRYDPIAQQPKDPQVRDALKRAEEAALIRAVNQGLQNNLDKSNIAYDLINNLPKFGLTQEQADACSRIHRNEGCARVETHETPYNIINLEQKVNMPPVKDLAHMKEGEFSHKYDRNFNLVNGEYKENNKERQALKQAQQKEMLVQRFIATHDYHPLVGEFYDGDKEARVREEEERRREIKRQELHSDKGPASVLRSEGNAFNVLNGQVYHPNKVAAIDAKLDATKNAHADFRHRNAQYCDALDEMYDKRQEMAVRRKQHPAGIKMLYAPQTFDITNNKTYGLSSKEIERSDDAQRMADVVKGHQKPAVPIPDLGPKTVAEKLATIDAYKNAAAEKELTRIPRGNPRTTFEKTLLLPSAAPAPAPVPTPPVLFRKSNAAPVTGAAAFVSSAANSARSSA